MVKNPRSAIFFFKTFRNQKKAAVLRNDWKLQGVEVPPVMIISVTNQCNLRCKGCYSVAQNRHPDEVISYNRLNAVISEAHQLGISVIILAGGEPFLNPDIFEVAAAYPRIVFPVFTNGVLIGDEAIARLKKNRNLIPVISIEGNREQTDERRGQGIFDLLQHKIGLLYSRNIFYGVSMTVTSGNLEIITGDKLVPELIDKGCRVFFFVEYVPVSKESEYLTPDTHQRAVLIQKIKTFREKLPALFIGFPGDEEQYGGCLAAGRGFVHISNEGFLEPCPFAPFSDSDLKKISLKEALKSVLLKEIRENHHLLSETSGGCALWANQDWLKSLQQDIKHNR